jgi:Domain of unknown function (DUF1816)
MSVSNAPKVSNTPKVSDIPKAFDRSDFQVKRTIPNRLASRTTSDLNWWVEIKTIDPRCIYYFGPFQCEGEALAYYPGYVEDLVAKGAENLEVSIKRCQLNP